MKRSANSSQKKKRKEGEGKKKTHSICLQPLPKVLHLLEEGIRRQNIDDAEIINRVHGAIPLVRRAYPAFVLVEDEMPSVGGVFVGEVGRLGREGFHVGLAHRATERLGFGLAPDLGRFSAWVMGEVRLGGSCVVVSVR